MTIGILRLDLRIPFSNSLKEKRLVLRSLKDRLKKFNISLAELDHQDKWQLACLAIVAVAGNKQSANMILSEVVNFIERCASVELINVGMEML